MSSRPQWRHGLSVACIWLRTPLEQAQVNAVERMVRRYGRLLSPEEMASVSRKDPNSFAPDAQFRYRDRLETSAARGGLFANRDSSSSRESAARSGREEVLFFEYDGVVRAPRPEDPGAVEILPNRVEALGRYAALGFRLLGVSYQPGDSRGDRPRVVFFERTSSSGSRSKSSSALTARGLRSAGAVSRCRAWASFSSSGTASTPRGRS